MIKGTEVLVLISLLVSGCALFPEGQREVHPPPPTPGLVPTEIIPAELPAVLPPEPGVQLPETDQIIFTIPNLEVFSGREGDPRPNWLGWGAETFTIAPDGTFWIADTAVTPNRLLHYSPQGELLADVSLADRVVYAFHLAATQNSLWVLDVSAQPPKIVQLDREGSFQANVDIPQEIMTTRDGHRIGNGVFNLFPGGDGKLLLDSVSGYYEMTGAPGAVTFQPLEAFAYYGHTYRRGIYDESTGQLPIYVDETLFEFPSGFSVRGESFVGFNPDGSFAITGHETLAQKTDFQVRYFSAAGELLGTARQQPQTFYKDFNHHLAFGPDGAVYQLLSNPDHSVQVLRLGFSKELPPVVELPVQTLTPLTPLQPLVLAVTEEEQARNVLVTFFDHLSNRKYAEAAPYFGGAFSEYAREQMPGETLAEYWEYMCDFLWCLPVAEITGTEQVSEDEFVFHVMFVHVGDQLDGHLSGKPLRWTGACCGNGGPPATPAVWQFAFPVEKIDGEWKVMRSPLFIGP